MPVTTLSGSSSTNTKFSGTIAFLQMNTSGVLHTNASGVLSTSLITNNDITNNTIANSKLASLSVLNDANTIACRDASGSLKVSAPTDPLHAVNKFYVDNKNSLGTYQIDTGANATTIACREAGGALQVGAPTASNHATTKLYVDNKITDVSNALVLKADNSYLNQKITDVSNALVLKVDLSNLNVSSVPNTAVKRDASGNCFITVQTQNASDISTKVATTEFVKTAINNLIGGAAPAYDTLLELQSALESDASSLNNLLNLVNTKAATSYVDNKITLGAYQIDTGANATTIACRETGGALQVGVPTANTHATTKLYVDSKTNLGSYNIDTGANATTIACRETDGALQVGVPTANTHATTKLYVDNKITDVSNALVLKVDLSNLSVSNTANSVVKRDASGNILALTQNTSDISTKVATTEFVATAINNLVGGAGPAYDTLLELQTALQSDSSSLNNLLTLVDTKASTSYVDNKTNLGSYNIDTEANATTIACRDASGNIAATSFNSLKMHTGTENSSVIISNSNVSTTLRNNVIIGNNAAANLVSTGPFSANSNVIIGSTAGSNIQNGAGNTLIGALADFDNLNSYNRSTAIGALAQITASNQIVLGTVTETTLIPGLVRNEGGAWVGGVVHVDATGTLSSSLIVNEDISSNTSIDDTKLATITTAGKVANSATSATANNDADTIVLRDASGNANITALTQNASDVSTKVATTEFVKTALNNLVGGAGPAYDTLLELQSALENDSSSLTNLLTLVDTKASTTYVDNKTALGGYQIDTGANPGTIACRDGAGNIAATTINGLTISGRSALVGSSGSQPSIVIGDTNGAKTTGSVYIGHMACNNTVSTLPFNGKYNIGIGYQAGKNNTTGSSNTFLGNQADFIDQTNAFNSSTALGANAKITASNQIVLGTADETTMIPKLARVGGGVVHSDASGNIFSSSISNSETTATTNNNADTIVLRDASGNANITALTQNASDISTKVATTEFVNIALASKASTTYVDTALGSKVNASQLSLTNDANKIVLRDASGNANITALTQNASDVSTKVATTQFVKTALASVPSSMSTLSAPAEAINIYETTPITVTIDELQNPVTVSSNTLVGNLLCISNNGTYMLNGGNGSVLPKRSTDGGVTFNQPSYALLGSTMTAVDMAMSASGQYQVIASNYNVGGNYAIYYSVDYGSNFYYHSISNQPNCVSISNDGTKITVGTSAGWYLGSTTAGSMSESTYYNNVGNVVSVAIAKNNPLIQYMIGNGRVWKSTNGGLVWSYLTPDNSYPPATVSRGYYVIRCSEDGKYVVVGDGENSSYLYTSSNYGSSFTRFIGVTGQWYGLSLSPNGKIIFAMRTTTNYEHILFSPDSGTSWFLYQASAGLNTANSATRIWTNSRMSCAIPGLDKDKIYFVNGDNNNLLSLTYTTDAFYVTLPTTMMPNGAVMYDFVAGKFKVFLGGIWY